MYIQIRGIHEGQIYLTEVISIYSPDLDRELARVEVDRYDANHLVIREGQITYVVQEN